jgi:hypothetical protein
MTDGERIQKLLDEYKFYQNMRDINERALFVLHTEDKRDAQRLKYYNDKISEYNSKLQHIRERIMVYGDY